MAYICVKNGSECVGCGDCEEPLPKCPSCGEECELFYMDSKGEVIGCEHCLTTCDSYNDKD